MAKCSYEPYEPKYLPREAISAPDGLIQTLIQAENQKLSAWINYCRACDGLAGTEDEFRRITGKDPDAILAEIKQRQLEALQDPKDNGKPLGTTVNPIREGK